MRTNRKVTVSTLNPSINPIIQFILEFHRFAILQETVLRAKANLVDMGVVLWLNTAALARTGALTWIDA
jgi:hypothetical protein